MMRSIWAIGLVVSFSSFGEADVAAGSAAMSFLYQGQLKQAGVPANGNFDFRFSLVRSDGLPSPIPTCRSRVPVVNGLFTVDVEFSDGVFDGSEYQLRVAVKPTVGSILDCVANTLPDPWVTLDPPQTIRPAPYAIHALTAPPVSSLDAPDGSPTQALAVANDGRIGIGTVAPQAELHVRPPTGMPLGTMLVTPGTSDATAQIKLTENTSATLGSILRYDGAANQFQVFGLTTGGVEVGPHFVVGRDNGRIGIGTTSPLTRLHVAGDVRVDGAIVIPPVERFLSIPAEDFYLAPNVRMGFSDGLPTELGLTTNVTGNPGVSAGTAIVTFAGIHLPDGAAVTEFQAKLLDTSATRSMTAYLMRESLAAANVDDIMASVNSVTNASGSTVQTDATVANSVVDNSAFLYRVVLEWPMPVQGEFVAFEWARIRYTVTTPLP